MDKLPNILPIFHIKSTVLMPRAQLPIVMSESEYFKISSEIQEDNIVGVVQPRPFISGNTNDSLDSSFRSGCAGKITDITSSDGDIIVNIQGVCRFEIISEIPSNGRLELALVSYEKYESYDLDSSKDCDFDKERLLSALDTYFKNLSIYPNWQEIEKTPCDVLVSALAMACPFNPSEKQSLLETVSMSDRTDMMTRMIEMNSFDKYGTNRSIN